MNDGSNGRHEMINLFAVAAHPVRFIIMDGFCNMNQDINNLQQDIDLLRPKENRAFLCRNETIFHGMGHFNRGIKAHNPGTSLDGMGRSHEGFKLIGGPGIVFQFQETVI